MKVVFPTEQLNSTEMDLHNRALRESAIYRRSESQLLEIICEIDVSRFFFKLGVSSTFDYCVKFLALSPAVTSNIINVARKSREVPELKSAVHTGELTVATARKIVPVINCENKTEWLEKAKSLTQAQLERAVANVTGKTGVERARPIRAGRVQLEIGISESLMRDFRRAQDIVSHKTAHAASLEEAFAAVVESYLAIHDPIRRADKKYSAHRARRGRPAGKAGQYQSASHARRAETADKSARSEFNFKSEPSESNFKSGSSESNPKSGSSESNPKSGPSESNPKPSHSESNFKAQPSKSGGDAHAKSSGTDSKHVHATAVMQNASPDVSETHADASNRSPTPTQVIHAVNLRDRGQCQAILPGGRKCGRTRFVHFHHKRPVAAGGASTVENLVTLCSSCHRQWHQRPVHLRSPTAGYAAHLSAASPRIPAAPALLPM